MAAISHIVYREGKVQGAGQHRVPLWKVPKEVWRLSRLHGYYVKVRL